MKIGVIIQGPLVTFGQGPNNVREGFNAINSIGQNIKNIKKFDVIKDYVVITWKPSNEKEQELADELTAGNVNIKPIEVPHEHDPDHRYKHHYAIQRGIAFLDAAEKLDVFIKIRTDMVMPLSFWEFAIRYADSGDARLCISELHFYPFYMGDFIYLAKRDTFCRFINSVLKIKSGIIHPIIASDIGMRYASHDLKKRKILQKLSIYGTYVFGWREHTNDWLDFASENITTIPKEIWEDIIWRKRKIADFLNAADFLFEKYAPPTRLGVGRRLFDLMAFYDKYGRLTNKNKFERYSLHVIRAVNSAMHVPRRIYNKLKCVIAKPKKKLLGRVACLGQDIFKLKFEGQLDKVSLVNMQKVRVDLFLEWVNGATRPVPEMIEPFLERKDIFDMIVQQKEVAWLKVKTSAEVILMDSFAELTDQRFTHKKYRWSFCCNYTDIDHNTAFSDVFEVNGLLSEEEISAEYDLFFSWIKENYPGKKIVYIHFPACLDSRIKFRERAAAILKIMLAIEKKFPNVVNLYIPDDLVSHHGDDNFPYHYSIDTQMAFINEWQKKIVDNANYQS